MTTLSEVFNISNATAQVAPDLLKALPTTKRRLITERRLTRQQFLAVDIFPTFLNARITEKIFQRSGKQDSFRHMRVQLVCIKVQAHSSLEPPLEYNQKHAPLLNQGLL